jgi:uncharacterized membrane protein
MLSFVPDSLLLWIINIILILGLLGTLSSYFIRFIPPLIPYAGTVKILGIALLVVGVWFRGGYDVESSWREKLRIAEEKARIAEQQAVEANNRINTKIVEKIKVVKENTVEYRDRIKEVEKIIDKECKVVPEAIDIHNAAAKNVKLGGSK